MSLPAHEHGLKPASEMTRSMGEISADIRARLINLPAAIAIGQTGQLAKRRFQSGLCGACDSVSLRNAKGIGLFPANQPNQAFCGPLSTQCLRIDAFTVFKNVLIRTRVSEIRGMGRATQGVTLIALDVMGVQRQVAFPGPVVRGMRDAVDRP